MLEALEDNVRLKISRSPYGKKLDDYDIKNLLGTGGYSKVYEATCFRTGSKVAIKIIEKREIHLHGLHDRILQEINIQSQLNYRFILKLYTAFEDSTRVYIVLELCSKGDLLKHINGKAVSAKNAKILMKQIVDGLDYLHSNGILHRDIKPTNILLDENLQIKIADFGMANRIIYPNDTRKTMCGTANFIAPEIVSKQPHDFVADIWSLGCLLYTLLVGNPPFESNTVPNTLNRVKSGAYYMPSYLSQSAQDLICQMLQTNPDDRISLGEIKQHPFLSDSCVFYNQKWVSSDSGVDTYSSSTNYLSSKFLSLDRKQHPSNHSNGYGSFETPKSSRRCRSQDRKLHDDVNPCCADMIFSDNLQNQMLADDQYDSFKLRNSYTKKSSNPLFSPVQRRTVNRDQNCEVFYENEVLNRKNDYWRCTVEKNSDVMLLPQRADSNEHRRKPSTKCQANGNTSESETEERVKVEPFNTERLKPKREELKNVILSILDNGDVCVERLRRSESRGSRKDEKMVVEVVRISKNGLKMHIYYPNKGRGVPVDKHPPPLPLNGADAVFNCDTLSKENWKKYRKAAQFVDMVKAKTPKLTLYTNKAKCLLMENHPDPDFQIIYHEGKQKITKSWKGIILEENGGKEYTLQDTGQAERSTDPRLAEHYKYFQECYRHCRFIEEQLTSIGLSGSGREFKVFPAILGKKPTCRDRQAEWDICTESPNIFHSTKYTT